jgi:hypothetical protein
VAPAKIRPGIPIGPGNNVLVTISIEISKAGSLAEKLLGKNQALEAV